MTPQDLCRLKESIQRFLALSEFTFYLGAEILKTGDKGVNDFFIKNFMINYERPSKYNTGSMPHQNLYGCKDSTQRLVKAS